MVMRALPVRCLRTVAGGYVQLFHGTPLLGNRYGAKQPVNTNLGTKAANQEEPYSAILADARLGRAKTVFKRMLESSGRR